MLSFIDRAVFPEICPICKSRPSCDVIVCKQCLPHLPYLPLPRCQICGGAVQTIMDICGECATRKVKHWEAGVSVFSLQRLPRELVHRFKYGKDTNLRRFLGLCMAENWERFGDIQPDIIVPIPLHWCKLLLRGFNQAEMLAQEMGRRLNIKTTQAIVRKHWTKQQARLNFQQRLRNVGKAFICRNPSLVEGKNVLLVDDVFTTGATLSAAAITIAEAGAASVRVMTLARR